MDYYKGNKLFGGVFSRDNLPKECGGDKFYIINLNKKHQRGSHWVAVISFDRCYYFDSFGIYPPPEIETFMKTRGKDIIISTYRIQALNSIMCGYFCLYIIDEMCKDRKFYEVLLDFDPNDFQQNDNLT